MIKIGKVSLNPEAFKGYTKEQFFTEYKGKLDVDKEVVWKMICKELESSVPFRSTPGGSYHGSPEFIKAQNESISSTGKQSKRTKRK